MSYIKGKDFKMNKYLSGIIALCILPMSAFAEGDLSTFDDRVPLSEKLLRMGIDVGSTTVKILILDTEKNEILYNHYERHHAEQWNTTQRLLKDVAEKFPGKHFRMAVCGSGGKPIAEKIGAHYIQEVVANSSAVRALYPQSRTAIELGGQDAKIIFFFVYLFPFGVI